MEKTLVLEPSTNTHTMIGVIDSEPISESIIKVKTNKNARVVHGEHGTIGISSEHVVKYVQQELDPISQELRNAWD